MKKTDWKETAELVGIAAIVASLLFVGLELRQSQRIAYAEMEGNQISALVGLNELVSENAALILKINAGEGLADREKIEAESLILSIHQILFFTRQRAAYLDHPSAETAERQLAIWLHENPGMRQLWHQIITRNDESHMAILGQHTTGGLATFRDTIRSHLGKLDQNRRP
jgi:hypothetical protein